MLYSTFQFLPGKIKIIMNIYVSFQDNSGSYCTAFIFVYLFQTSCMSLKNIQLNAKLDRKTYCPNNPLCLMTLSPFQLPKTVELLVCMVAFPEGHH